MEWRPCPICNTKNPPGNIYCSSCAADFNDPDVIAMAPSASQSLRSIGDAGELSASKFLGFSHDGMIDGRGIRLLGLIFGVIMLLGFVMPVTKVPVDYDSFKEKYIFESLMSWDIWSSPNVSKLGLLLPLILGVLGLAAAFVPKIPAHARAGALAVFGLVALFLSVGKIGELIGLPARTLSIINVGLIAVGIAGAVRVLRPKSRDARLVLAGGAALIALGYLIPLGEVGSILPGEYHRWAPALEADMSSGVTLPALLEGFDRRAPEVLFTAFILLAPLLAAPLAAWFAWKMPAGPWDKGSLALRPLAWFLVLAVPLAYGLYAFNAMGFTRGEDAVLLGRIRVLLIVTSATMWIHIGGAAVFDWYLRTYRENAESSSV
jgi:hypothetical protein